MANTKVLKTEEPIPTGDVAASQTGFLIFGKAANGEYGHIPVTGIGGDVTTSQLDSAVSAAVDPVAASVSALETEQTTLTDNQTTLTSNQVVLTANQAALSSGQATIAAEQTALSDAQDVLAASQATTSGNQAVLQDAQIDSAQSTGRVANGARFIDFELSDGTTAPVNITNAFLALQREITFKDGAGATLITDPVTIIIKGAGVTATADTVAGVLTLDFVGGTVETRANSVFADVTMTNYASLVAWYDPSDATTVTSSGGLVSALADKSPNGHDMVQATGADQPALVAEAVSGLNVLQFDGVSTVMRADSAASAFDGTDLGLTWHFILLNADLANTEVQIGLGSSSSGTIGAYFGNQGNSAYRFNKRSSGSVDVPTPFNRDDKAHVFSVVHSGTSTDLWMDGHKIVSAAAQDTGALTLDRFSIGAWARTTVGNFAQGELGEMAFFSVAQSDADVKAIHGYLSKKWFAMIPDVDFVIGMGQSNMVGRAETGYSVPDVKTGTAHEWNYSASVFSMFADPVGLHNPLGGLATQFAIDWKALTGRQPCVVNTGYGSSSLIPEAAGANGYWKPSGTGGTNRYTNCIGYANAAIAAIETASVFTINQVIALWCQGEKDGGELSAGTAGVTDAIYQADLTELVNDLSTDLTRPCDIFMISELGAYDGPGDRDAAYVLLRAAQAAVATALDNTHMGFARAKEFLTDVPPKQHDDDHYTQAGYNEAGAALALAGAAVALDPLVA